MSNNLKIYLLATISFLLGTAEYIIAGILDQIALDLALPISVVGQMVTVFSLAFAIGTPLVITFTSQINRKWLLSGFLLLFSLSNMVAILLPSYGLLNIARAISGLSAGVVEVLLLTLAAILAAPGKKASAIATIIVGFSAALVVGVPVGRMASQVLNWRFIFFGIGLLSLLSLIAVLRVIPHTQGEKTVPLSQQIKLLKNKEISILYLMTLFWISAFSIIYSYISPYLLVSASMSDNEISIMLLLCGLASILGSHLGGRFTDKVGYVMTLSVGFAVHCLVLVLFTLFSQVTGLMYLLLLIWSSAAWSSGPALQFRLISLAPQSTSIIFSFYTSMIQFGMAVGAVAGAVVIEKGHISHIAVVGALSVLVSLVLLIKITAKKTSKKSILSCPKSPS